MGIKELKQEIDDEVSTILANDFEISVIETNNVPHSDDQNITFPNLDSKRQRTKLIDTCVLYIDIRRSTELNFKHRQHTVAKLYSAFVRAMTRCARFHKGHVRGIIGDRVMVIFDSQNAFVNAVECALSMNSTAQYVIDKHFNKGEVKCGIGIDAGKMLATKTGILRRGEEQHNYKNLVWLGRPANVASKLTDLANKPEESLDIYVVNAAFRPPPLLELPRPPSLLDFGIPPRPLGSMGQLFDDRPWQWREIYCENFVRQLSIDPSSNRLIHSDPQFVHMGVGTRKWTKSPATGAILMTEAVWKGCKAADPNRGFVVNGLFNEIELKVPNYTGKIFSGNAVFTAFQG